MSEQIKNYYNYKKIKLEDGDYLDINITLPLPKEPITSSDDKFLKTYIKEAVEMVSGIENKNDSDLRIKAFINFHNFAKILYPTFIYTTVIIYKKYAKNINPNNSRKENMIPKLKGLGASFLFVFLASSVYKLYQTILNEGRLEFLKEILDSTDDKILDDYEKFKFTYADSIDDKKLI